MVPHENLSSQFSHQLVIWGRRRDTDKPSHCYLIYISMYLYPTKYLRQIAMAKLISGAQAMPEIISKDPSRTPLKICACPPQGKI